MSLRAVHAGNGYQYLLRSVATNDAYHEASDSGKLAAYYAAKGTPPGRWRGAGLRGFKSETITDGAIVEADQMASLYGLGMHPNSDAMLATGSDFGDCKLGGKFPVYTNKIPVLQALHAEENRLSREEKRLISDEERTDLAMTIGRQFYVEATGYEHPSGKEIVDWVNQQKQQVKQAVAGYDLTFSPAKSVSVLWALADEDMANAIAACHHRAVAEALEFVETSVARTRRGAQGIAQVATKGIIAAEFTHFDTRAGDPDLHSHVLVSNKVQAADGTWLALDGQPLFLHHQAISARYDTALHRILDEELGLSMQECVRENGKESVWEVAGVSNQLLELFSKRRALARPVFKTYVADYIAKYGRQPDKLTQKSMWQQAILDTRDAKKPAESLTELRKAWRDEVAGLDHGTELLAQIGTIGKIVQQKKQPLFFDAKAAADVHDLADMILSRVSAKRSYFCRHHLDTAASVVLKAYRFATAEEQHAAREQLVETALDHAVCLTPDELLALPDALIRTGDHQAVDRRLGSEKFTTQAILDAEATALQAVVEPTAIFASNASVNRALRQHTKKHGWSLNDGQADLAHHLLNAGTVAACGVGPAGTGKTTSMRLVTDVWRATGRAVIGLAPSAAAAEVLSEEIGIDTMTIDRLTFTWRGSNPDREAGTLDNLPIEIHPGDMLMVDEAGMATTENIAALCDIARQAGAVVRFIGDPHQLDAVGNGGLFGAMCNAAPAAELTDVMRFSKGKDLEQAEASLKLRKGLIEGIDFHNKRGWVHGGTRTEMLTQAVQAFLDDVERGRESLVIASTNEDVDTINEMIRTHRIGTGEVKTKVEVTLSHGDNAGVGDIIIARKNKKWWKTGANGRSICTGRVHNGQLFTITKVRRDGSLQVRDAKGYKMVLPSDYVKSECHLGYAATIHRSQGATVDTVHAVIDDSTNRAGLYVALTRGSKENRVWAVTDLTLDETAEDGHYHMAGNDQPPGPIDVVAAALARDDRQVTATETLAQEYAAATSVDRKHQLYRYAVELATEHFINATFGSFQDAWTTEGTEKVRHVWKTMLMRGIDPRPEMHWATAELGGSRDAGAVVAWRLQQRLAENQLNDVAVPPPLLISSDRQLDAWMRATYTELSQPAVTDLQQGHSLVDHLTAGTPASSPLTGSAPDLEQGHSLVDHLGYNAVDLADSASLMRQPDFPAKEALEHG